jgi:ubiquinone/menaquinone biosynthesis C-methylase UbiE
MTETTDTAAFHAFERAGWERAAEPYADTFGALTPQAATPLLDAVGARTGTPLLDVACGPGFVGGLASSLGAHVTAIDFSPAMIEQARRRYPAVRFLDGDAAELPFDDESFDGVVMNFGMLHLARPDQAIAEAHRVLKPGGRYAFTVWAEPSVAVGFGFVIQAVERLGNPLVALPEGPPFFRFSSDAESRTALTRVGFQHVEIRSIPLVWRLGSPDGVFDALSRGGVRTAAVLRAQSADALKAIQDSVRRDVEHYRRGDMFEVPMPAVLTIGRKK